MTLPNADDQTPLFIDTGDGTYIAGNVTSGGDFVGRDKTINVTINYSVDPANSVPTTTIDIDKVQGAFEASHAGFIGLNHDDIAGRHIVRAELTEIMNWLTDTNTTSKQSVGVLSDVAGGGKTALMREILNNLKRASVPTLAIKADLFDAVESESQLAERLGLQSSVRQCMESMSEVGTVVLLIDQLDALSQFASRSQIALDVLINLVSQMVAFKNVRVLVSCRTFDLKHDARLAATFDPRETARVSVRHFFLNPLDLETVKEVVRDIGVEPDRLTDAQMELMRTPLHLKLFELIAADDSVIPGELKGLQDLYEAIWTKLVSPGALGTTDTDERKMLMYAIAEKMNSAKSLSVPVAEVESSALYALAHAGLIELSGGRARYFHQTLFDYVFARKFVAEGGSLSGFLLGGPQGLFERSQMLQVTAYLRQVAPERYRDEVCQLLSATSPRLRPHLRRLLMRWLGASIGVPQELDIAIVTDCITDGDTLQHFLHAAQKSAPWFDARAGASKSGPFIPETEFQILVFPRFFAPNCR